MNSSKLPAGWKSTLVVLAGFLPQSNAALTVDLGSASSFAVLAGSGITGALTLDAGDDPNAVWIFLASSTLRTASGSQVVFLDGIGNSCNAF